MTKKVQRTLRLYDVVQLLYEKHEDTKIIETIEDVLDSLWYDMSAEEQDYIRSECGKRANYKTT
jgi:formate dehydrogenase maturation protein FdhE